MKDFNTVMYVIGIITTFCTVFSFGEDEPDFVVALLFYWLFAFAWGYYHELRKPKEERSYTAIVGSIGFMVGLAIPLMDGAGFRGSLLGGVLGLGVSLTLWVIAVYNLNDRYPFLKPKSPQKASEGDESMDEDELYDDIG